MCDSKDVDSDNHVLIDFDAVGSGVNLESPPNLDAVDGGVNLKSPPELMGIDLDMDLKPPFLPSFAGPHQWAALSLIPTQCLIC